MGAEPTAEDIAAFAEVMEQIERKNRHRLFYDLFPDKDMAHKDGSTIHARAKYAILPGLVA